MTVRSGILCLVLLLGTAACAVTLGTQDLPVPEALATSQPWTVEMRHDWRRGTVRYRFGPYHVENVHHGEIRQRGGVVDALKGKREYQQRYSFAIADSAAGARPTRVQCDGRDRDRGFSIGSVDIELESGMSLECRLQVEADTGAAWVLKLGGRDDDPAAGVLERGGTRYEVTSDLSTAETGEKFAPAYLVRRDSAFVAMAYRAFAGLVRISPDLEPSDRDVIAAALMALVLQRPLIEE